MTDTGKRIWLWTLYDFANSLAYMAVSFYFALWFIADKGGASFWVAAPVALATLALLFSLPTLGAWSDKLKRRIPFLAVLTWLGVASLVALGLFAARSNTEASLSRVWIIVLYFFFTYFYQASLAFHDAFLVDVTGEKTREHTSGLGYAGGQLGNLAILVLAIPFVQQSGRPVAFLLGAAGWFLFSLPVLFFLKDKDRLKTAGGDNVIVSSLARTLSDFKNLRRQYPNVLLYLITFYLFADAILTLQLFATIYLEVVVHMSDAQKTLVGGVMLFFGVLGAAGSGFLARKLRQTKKAIAGAIIAWAVLLGLTALASSSTAFIILAAGNGLAYGSLFALSRAFYSQLVPSNQQAEFFSIYVLFEKFASILGPLLWSLTIFVFAGLGQAPSYRLAVVSQALLVVASFFTLRFVRESKSSSSALV